MAVINIFKAKVNSLSNNLINRVKLWFTQAFPIEKRMDKTLAGKKILWVEDDAFLSGLIGQRFGGLGATLFSAATGEQAIQTARTEKPDIILLDILLPGLGGFDILKVLKQDPNTKDIPVVILSNLSQQDDIEKGKALGAVSFLIKATVNLDEIVAEAKRVLGVK